MSLKKNYTLMADDEATRDEWVEHLSKTINKEDIIYRGYLTKYAKGLGKESKKRFFVLSLSHFTFYTSIKMENRVDEIQLSHVNAVEKGNNIDESSTRKEWPKDKTFELMMSLKKNYTLMADDEATRDEWVEHLSKTINKKEDIIYRGYLTKYAKGLGKESKKRFFVLSL